MAATSPGQRITRGDIEAKLRQIQDSTNTVTDAARGPGLAGIVAAGALAVLAAYLLGRRRGRKRRTVVEIRRV